MKPTVVGINYRTAPLEAREQVALVGDVLREAHQELAERTGQAVILSTCNRTEFYTLTENPEQGLSAVAHLLEGAYGVRFSDLASSFYTYHHDAAARHLFRVGSSLDSMILGESEILGQVREAFGAAVAAKTVRNPLSRLFHQALRVSKRARQETEIGRNALSVSYACVDLARRTLGDLRGLKALVVGSGEAGKLAAKALSNTGVAHLAVTNRTFAGAEALAQELGGRALPFEGLEKALTDADIVVSCTGAPTHIITQDLVAQAMQGRNGRQLFLLDIAVPRDVDPVVAQVPGVHLSDIDDLEALARSNRQRREREAQRVEIMVEEEVQRYLEWWNLQSTVPAIAAVQRQAEGVRQREVARALRRLRHLAPEDQETVEAMSRALVKKLLHAPITTLKAQRDPRHAEVLRELFDLDQEEG